jgi:hypothetical protein
MYNLFKIVVFGLFFIILLNMLNMDIEPFNVCTRCNKYQYCDMRVGKCYPLPKKNNIFFI